MRLVCDSMRHVAVVFSRPVEAALRQSRHPVESDASLAQRCQCMRREVDAGGADQPWAGEEARRDRRVDAGAAHDGFAAGVRCL